MSVTPDNPGTEAVTPAVGEATPEAQAPEGFVPQDKYEAQLQRLTALEQGKQAAETRAAELERIINERLDNPRSTTAQPDDVAEDIAAVEQNFQYLATNGATPEERRLARWFLGMAAHVRGLPTQFNEQIALAPLPAERRAQVQQLIKEAAQSGNRLTPEMAGQIVDLRNAQAELTKMKATPPPQPPNTSVRPSPVPINTGGTVTYAQMSAEWPTATPQRKDELRALEKAGKVVPG